MQPRNSQSRPLTLGCAGFAAKPLQKSTSSSPGHRNLSLTSASPSPDQLLVCSTSDTRCNCSGNTAQRAACPNSLCRTGRCLWEKSPVSQDRSTLLQDRPRGEDLLVPLAAPSSPLTPAFAPGSPHRRDIHPTLWEWLSTAPTAFPSRQLLPPRDKSGQEGRPLTWRSTASRTHRYTW